MDINKLSYFFAAVEAGNFTKAAEKCHIAQTTMSKYIASLEKETGILLFTRTPNGMALTEKGRHFYVGMKEIHQAFESLLHELSPEKPSLIIGLDSQEYRGIDFMPLFLKKYPELSVSYRMEPPEILEKELSRGEIDAIIAPEAIPFSKDFISHELVLIPQSLVCAAGKADKVKSMAGLISSLPFLTKADDPDYVEACRNKFLKAFGAAFKRVEKIPTFSEQLLRLSLGEGFAILPLKPGTGYDNLYAFPLDKSFAEKTCLICRKGRLSPLLQALIEFAHEKKC